MGVKEQLVRFRNPHRLAASAQPVVQNDAGRLTALAAAGAVAKEEPFAELHRCGVIIFGKAQIVQAFVDAVAARKQFGMRFACINDGLDLRVRENARFDQSFRQQGPVGRKRRPD